MTLHRHLHGRIYPLFETMAQTLELDRQSLANEDRDSHNITIILCRACLVEGVLEEQAYRVIRYFRSKYRQVDIPEFSTRKPVNVFVNGMIEDLEVRAGRATGIENFSTLLNSMLGTQILSVPTVSPYAEGIRTLFQLRNVIAHGRAVRASVVVRGPEHQEGEETFAGGYSLAEKYLLKVGVISRKFTSQDPGEWLSSDGVADHFSSVASQFMIALIDFIDSALADMERSTIPVPRRR